MASLVVLLPAMILAGAWRLGGVSALEDDLIYYLPVRQYIGECLRRGEFPWWNPLVGMGTPVAADPQAGVWYPPTYLFAALPPLWAYPLTIIGHFALAGAGMYRFLRACRHAWPAALFGALAFEFSGFLVAHRVHLTMLEAAAWLPWMFYGWQRFAHTGRYRHFALATFALGLQLLVQHIQISIIGGVLLTGYVVCVLWPRRRSLWWEYPAGLAVAGLIGAIQLLPTFLHFAGSIRSAPAWHLFIENSWWPSSALLMLFPMLFGSRTPNLWSEPWWGPSHFCEQSAYASILVLILAMASLSLLRRPAGSRSHRIRGHHRIRGQSPFRGLFGFPRSYGNHAHSRCSGEMGTVPSIRPAGSRSHTRQTSREALFWWAAVLIALLIALGHFTPLSSILFHLPVYRSLRVPARWILVWSFALPVLASTVLSMLIRNPGDDPRTAGLRRGVSWIAGRMIPGLTLLCLLLLVLVRWRVDWLAQRIAGYEADRIWAGVRQSLRIGNPAIWWPILLIAASAWILSRWARKPSRSSMAGLIALLVIDLASVAAFVDVDTQVYSRAELTREPPLAAAIGKASPRPGDRLLVPRETASYERPLEVLWPHTNVAHSVRTFQSYGPLWTIGHRQLFRFQPWGSSEEIVALLRNTALCRAMGIRFVAVRSAEERRALAAAGLPATTQPARPIPGTESELSPVVAGDDLLWPVTVDRPGLYELTIEVEPLPGSTNRWFVRLESLDGQALANTRTMDPSDLALGPRRVRCLFDCPTAPGEARIRVKSETGRAVLAGQATFGITAAKHETDRSASRPTAQAVPAKPGEQFRFQSRDRKEAVSPPSSQPLPYGRGSEKEPFVHLGEIENVSVYELPGTRPLVYWADNLVSADSLSEAVEILWRHSATTEENPPIVVIERPPTETTGTRNGQVASTRWVGTACLEVEVTSSTGGVLVFAQSGARGWQAWVDGRETPLLRAQAVHQAVVVSAGPHVVRFRYRPAGMTAGATASLGGVILLMAGWIATSIRRPTYNCSRSRLCPADRESS